jgi:hypothetical protein
MTIYQDILSPNPSPFIELFQIDLSSLGYSYYVTDPYESYKTLHMPLTGNFNDLKGNTVNIVGSPSLTSIGGESCTGFLNGDTNYLSVNSINFGSGDFSLRLKAYFTTKPDYNREIPMMQFGNTASIDYFHVENFANTFFVFNLDQIITFGDVAINTWTDIHIWRYNGLVYLKVNAAEASPFSGPSIFSGSRTLYIGTSIAVGRTQWLPMYLKDKFNSLSNKQHIKWPCS